MATVSNLTKEEYRKYQDGMMTRWDEYAIKETLLKQGREEGRQEEKKLLIANLLKTGDFTIAKIATIVGANQSLIRKIKKELNL